MDIVLVTRDRPELTVQTILSMRENAANWSRHRFLGVYDGEELSFIEFWEQLLDKLVGGRRASEDFYATGKQLGVGGAKNYGAGWFAQMDRSQEPFSSELLMFSDNDMYYLPEWDRALEVCIDGDLGNDGPVVQLGGWRHPFHAKRRGWGQHAAQRMFKIPEKDDLYEVDAVTGNCFVIRWCDWLKYGPFDATAIGPGQSEDYALSQKIKAGGGLVATLDPPVAIHCGIVNSEGQPATGWHEMLDMAMKQLTENGLLDKVDLLVPDSVVDAVRGIKRALSRVPNTPVPPEAHTIVEKLRKERTATQLLCLNVGSGQRRFDSPWVNVDSQSIAPDRVPDLICNVGRDPLPFDNDSAQLVVLHQVLEHFGCNESEPMLRECWRILAPGGSLIVTVPDMRALAGRWLGGEIDTQLFMTNVYGAYMGSEDDRHLWGFERHSLHDYLRRALPEQGRVVDFDWREIPGASIVRDWWILGVEAVKS